jgi:hypothetical protein
MAVYVKAYAFFISIAILIGLCVAAGILYGENQRTSDLFKTLMSDFEIKMVNITTNNSVLMSTLTTNFQTQMATMNTQIETLATAKGNLEAQVATLTATSTAYQTMYINQLNITTSVNATWGNFLKALNKGLSNLKLTNTKVDDGKVNFTKAYNALLATTYTPATQNATYSWANYNSSRSLFNTSLSFFQIANNKVNQNWTNTLVTMYVNLNPIVQNFTYEMGQTCHYLKIASSYYAASNTTAGNANKAIMLSRWNLYNTSYVSYTNALKAIDVFVGV